MSLFGEFVSIAFVLWALGYLIWRGGTLNPEAPIFSGLIYGAEIFGFVTTLLHLFMVWQLTVRVAPKPAPGLAVDIFVPTYNESAEIVRRTLIAAKNVDYPHGIWLLDDGNRAEMAALAQELGVNYLARSDNSHAKAGNLNNALKHSQAEFIAIFDADHAPKRNFLDETLGYFQNDKVAFVQTPQDFFNLDSFQHRKNEAQASVWTEQSLFFRVIQRGKDRWGAAFFCGSCAVIRRAALDHIGGFATTSITEDLETSVELHQAGYESVYVPDALAFGIAPSSASAYLRQRIRWGQGAMQVIRKQWFFLRGRLTLPQRLNYMASTLTYFDGWAKAIFYVAPVWVLLSGQMPLLAPMKTFLPIFLPYLLLTFLVFEEAGRGYGRSLFIEQYNMARFAAFIWATLGLIPRRLQFKVTPKDTLSAAEVEMRALSPQIAVAAINLFGIVLGVALWFLLSGRGVPLDGLLINITWALVNAGMAFLVVRFTLQRTRFQRETYRFPIPLPASANFGSAYHLMTVDDISLTGCRMYGRFPLTIKPGDSVKGTLFLPGDQIPFDATVARLVDAEFEGVRYHKSIGLSFTWADSDSQDRLGLFLYGSDLQWRLRNLSERIATPLEATRRLVAPRADETFQDVEQWSAALVDNATTEYALISVRADSKERFIACYRKLDDESSIIVRSFTRRRIERFEIRPVRAVAQLSTPTGTLYLYSGEAHALPVTRGAAPVTLFDQPVQES